MSEMLYRTIIFLDLAPQGVSSDGSLSIWNSLLTNLSNSYQPTYLSACLCGSHFNFFSWKIRTCFGKKGMALQEKPWKHSLSSCICHFRLNFAASWHGCEWNWMLIVERTWSPVNCLLPSFQCRSTVTVSTQQNQCKPPLLKPFTKSPDQLQRHAENHWRSVLFCFCWQIHYRRLNTSAKGGEQEVILQISDLDKTDPAHSNYYTLVKQAVKG